MTVSTEVNPRLAALTAAGTSVWLDQIRRSLIENGELQRLIDEYSLRGVTANPAIFEKAILGSDDYDADIKAMAQEGLDAKAMYDRIAVTDVQMAADVMRPVWDEHDHDDGFVSLEVDPDLAHDTEGTLKQVRAFWGRLDRPNVFIKIPGTEEGVPAIEQSIYEGINVNVTLLFAVDAYAKVAEAYIRGLERRLDEGKSVDVRSVASFFVSRVDTEVDKRLEKLGHPELQGMAAAGIDLDDVTAKLLRDGIEAFVVSLRQLLAGIEDRRDAVVTNRPPTISARIPPELEGPIAERVKRATAENVAQRVWRKDPTLWAPEGTPEIADRLG